MFSRRLEVQQRLLVSPQADLDKLFRAVLLRTVKYQKHVLADKIIEEKVVRMTNRLDPLQYQTLQLVARGGVSYSDSDEIGSEGVWSHDFRENQLIWLEKHEFIVFAAAHDDNRTLELSDKGREALAHGIAW